MPTVDRMHLRVRRRSLKLDGGTLVISVAIKSPLGLPDDHKIRIRLSSITGVSHSPATTWSLGRIVFSYPDAASGNVGPVPMFADKLPANTIQYSLGQREKVDALLAAIAKARGK